jgi:hypothetical protein
MSIDHLPIMFARAYLIFEDAPFVKGHTLIASGFDQIDLSRIRFKFEHHRDMVKISTGDRSRDECARNRPSEQEEIPRVSRCTKLGAAHVVEPPGLLNCLAGLLLFVPIRLVNVLLDELGPLLGCLVVLRLKFKNSIATIEFKGE